MKSKKELHHELLTNWKLSDKHYETNFRIDGIIDEDQYEKANTKILFICKEPNGRNHPERFEGNFCDEWRNEGAQYQFSRTIAEWSYGILNNFPPIDSIINLEKRQPEYKKALSAISFMNVKKSSGGGSSILSVILTSIKKDKEFILEQIKIIAPEIIILGLSWPQLRNEIIAPTEVEWKKSGYQIDICKWNDAKVICFHHPSSRAPSSASYSLLQNVINSEAFKTL